MEAGLTDSIVTLDAFVNDGRHGLLWRCKEEWKVYCYQAKGKFHPLSEYTQADGKSLISGKVAFKLRCADFHSFELRLNLLQILALLKGR